MNAVRREDLDLMICQTPDCIAQHSGNRQHALDTYQAQMKAYEPLIAYPGEREIYQKCRPPGPNTCWPVTADLTLSKPEKPATRST